MRSASRIERTSPLPMTGMRSTASTTARMPSRLTEPLKPCSRVRPWIVTAATPTRSNSRAKYGAVRLSASQPSRIFTVTGDRDRLDDLGDEVDGRAGRVAHHGRAAAAANDFANRAAHVDVDDRRAVVLDPLGAVGEVVGAAAVDLHGERAILRARREQFDRAFRALQDGAGIDEIGRAQADAADVANAQAERQVGVARQRRQGEARGEFDMADAQRAIPARQARRRRKLDDGGHIETITKKGRRMKDEG